MAAKFIRVISTTHMEDLGWGGFVEMRGTKKRCMEHFEDWFNVPGTVWVEVRRVEGNNTKGETIAKLERTYEEAKAMTRDDK